ncbi:MAG: MoxR family ATPase [candidate division WS1 bacterium]|jgi:MoxR-like ATPase|nr:MoxR family ATPase [candidate division WS1 bacterium]
MAVAQAAEVCHRIADNVERVIIGKREAIERTLVAMIARGHVLLEDVPGVGKTMLARSLAASVGGDFRRIQFTPDLLPTDVTGVSIYDQRAAEFAFRPGPVFANIVLADEINRASPRTQSSLLEAMEERQVTVDGVTHRLPRPFMVIATENPIEYEGVYPLPESQLDRFLLRFSIGYPQRDEEKLIVREQLEGHPVQSLESVATSDEVEAVQQVASRCHVSEAIYDYALDLVEGTRASDELYLGAGPRGSLALVRCAQGIATLEGRDFVGPDDVKSIARAALAHRLIPRPEARVSGVTGGEVVDALLERIPVPS